MGELFAYSLVAGFTLIPLYLIIRLFLTRCTFSSFNRFVILTSYLIALAMPIVIHLRPWMFMTTETAADNVSVVLPDRLDAGQMVVADNSDNIAGYIASVLLLVYCAGLLFFMVREAMIWFRMARLIRSCSKTKVAGRWTLCLHNQVNMAPFSWKRYIVMSTADYADGGDIVITHENMHLACHHWADLILAEAVAMFLWYNPVGWLMRNELQTVHEYEADRAVLDSGVNAKEYQLLLIKKAVGARFPSIANSLDHSNLSKRIKMMLRKKSSPGKKWLAIAALPSVALCAAVMLSPAIAEAIETVSMSKVTNSSAQPQISDEPVAAAVETKAIENSSDEPYKTSEKMPRFPGGEVALMKFMMDNLKYPAGEELNGRVVAQFVVRKDGSIGDVNIIKPLSESADAEVVRLIKSLPAWTPGEVGDKPVDVWYTIPVSFRTNGDESSVPQKESESSSPSADNQSIYKTSEKMPRFPGGEVALMKFMMDNLKYPAGEELNGRVVAQFVVRKDGSIGDVNIIKPLSESADAEVVRLIKSLPAWTPGEVGGKPVDVWYTIPVSFRTKVDEDKTVAQD